MREILNRYTFGRLTAVYRREGDIVELLLVPAGSEGSIARVDCAAEPLIQAKLTEDDAPAFFQRRAHNAQQPHRKSHAVCRADRTKICR